MTILAKEKAADRSIGVTSMVRSGYKSLKSLLRHILRPTKRLALCAAGAAIGLGLTLWITGIDDPFLLASLGGSTVFLFGLTRTPAAQPRALFGGHLGGALIGILCYQAFGAATWVYILAVAMTMIYMLLSGTVHPPAGANPLLMVHHHASFSALWEPVGLSIVLLAAAAFAWTRIVSGMVHYPAKWMDASPPTTFGASWESE
ncbi:HPP family protein [Oxalobacteraceae bacterium R-40]|uniref:HPP family protein n=1 Tax=Keguizhuia sedimenti TaxID=3064264 RepID=A0ABU1BS88_9BURK|nr:HPP family protein [Oxalobacteraceae bacterium R-40]